MAKLREQVNKNSRNFFKSPSSDPSNKRTYPTSEPSGRKKGAQPGYAGKGRKLNPPTQVTWVMISKPVACSTFGALLLGENLHPQRNQVSELSKIEGESKIIGRLLLA